ncbi:MAG TPA: RHS repeat-associated core domain-containing protein [Thermoanaerobaculia bacterium]|jgi:RHS repeat-associated protein
MKILIVRVSLCLFLALAYAYPAAAWCGYACGCPEISGELGPINADGTFAVTIRRTDYPSTGLPSLNIYFKGGLISISSIYLDSNPDTIVLSAFCMTEPSELRIVPKDCYANEYTAGQWSTTIGGESQKPVVNVTLDKAFDPAAQKRRPRATVTWDFGDGTNNWSLSARLRPWTTADGQSHGGETWPLDVTEQSGTQSFFFNAPGGAHQYAVEAIAQSCTGRATSDDSDECGECDGTSSGNPVYYDDGNMRLHDADPLPSIAGQSLARTYDSDEQVRALFGRGWTSIFERRLIVETSGGDQIVSLVSANNDVATFRGSGGAFRQTWPQARAADATLTYDATAATYTYRGASSPETATFRAGDGALLRLGNIATGRFAQLAYDAQGLPQSVTDSWSGLAWLLTVDAVERRITSIAVSGRPDLVWNYVYDASGNLLSVLTADNSPWRTYDYAAAGMTASHDAAGNLLESHAYDAGGAAINSTGNIDEIASIEYDLPGSTADERITRVTAKNGTVTDYTLRSSGGSWRTVKVEGGCSSCGGAGDRTLVRDRFGRVIRQQSADGYVDVTAYTGGTVSSRIASQRRYLVPAGCDPASDVGHCRLTVDALAAAALDSTAATVETSYEYSDPNWPERVTAMTRPSVVVAAATRRETTTYDATTGTVLTKTVSGRAADTTVVERTRTTTLYEVGSPAPAFTPGGAFDFAWLSLPQPVGLTKTIDGPRTDVADAISYVYYPVDADVPALLRGRLAATKNAAGHIAHYDGYDEFGNATRIVDANGVAVEMTYDALGRVVTSTVKASSGCNTTTDPLCATDLTTTRTYSPAAGPLVSEQQPGGGVTQYTYDGRGRVVTVSRGPAAADLRERMEYTYDANTGKKTRERALAFEAGVWVESRSESFAYDALTQLSSVTHADDSSVGYAYDSEGRVASQRDENHAAANTFYVYDAAGRLSQVRQQLGATAATTGYTYDIDGNLRSVTDPNGNVTTYTFDDFGQMTAQQSPVTGTTSYAYDVAGELLSTTDANGAVTARTYDALGRVLTAVSSRTGAVPATVTWNYDDATAGHYGIGRLATMNDPTGSTTYRYEHRGALREETRAITTATDTYTTSFGFDADGNRTRIDYPSGLLTVAYTYDYAGRPLTASGAITAASYAPFGGLTALTFANGTIQSMPRDSRGRVIQNALDGPSGSIAQYAYQYDAASNITAITDVIDAGYSRTFAYDELGRLITANSGSALWGTGAYTYDLMGNMLSLELGKVAPGDTDGLSIGRRMPRLPQTAESHPLGRTVTFAYVGTTSRLAEVTTNDLSHTVAYDAAGNETSHYVNRAYSPRNLLATVTDSDPDAAGHTISYAYDGRGIRVVAAETPANGANTTSRRYYVNSPELRLLSVTRFTSPVVWYMSHPASVDKNVSMEIVWFGDRPVAQVAPGGPTRFTFADHLGTPLIQTDAAGTIIWRIEHEPFGNPYAIRAGTRLDQPLRLPGQDVAMSWEGTEETYNVFRWYRPGWGRYTQADPIGLRGGANLFRYGDSSPTVRSDRLGLTTWDCVIGTVAKGGEILGGALVTASCKSECKAGKRRFVQLAGGAGGVTVGVPGVGTSKYTLQLTDWHGEAKAEHLDGSFSIHALGAAALVASFGMEAEIHLGDAYGKTGITSGADYFSLGASFDNFWGATHVILDVSTCCL